MRKDYRNRLYSRYVTSHLPGAIQERVKVRAHYLRKLIDAHFPKKLDSKILEIGCGHGALIYYAKEKGYSYLEGVDVSLEQVDEAHKIGLSDCIRQEDLMVALRKSEDSSYDAIVALDVIEHMAKNELLDLVEELYRVLCVGGKLILHMPNAASPFFGRVRYGDYTHEQAFTRTSLSQLLLTYSFSEVQCFEDAPIVHGIKSAIRWGVWKAMSAVYSLILISETGTSNEIFTQNFLAIATKSEA